jgi:hypothetical protein
MGLAQFVFFVFSNNISVGFFVFPVLGYCGFSFPAAVFRLLFFLHFFEHFFNFEQL